MLALGLTTAFMLAEVIGALITGSLALLSDAAHMFTDSAAEIQLLGMLVIASIGLVVNPLSMRLLRAGSGESLNVKGA